MIELRETRRKGGPLVMLALVLVSWVGARAMLWENPLPVLNGFAPIVSEWMAFATSRPQQSNEPPQPVLESQSIDQLPARPQPFVRTQVAYSPVFLSEPSRAAIAAYPLYSTSAASSTTARPTRVSLGHQLLFSQAFVRAQLPYAARNGLRNSRPGLGAERANALAQDAPGLGQTSPLADRWSFDSWAFFRQGSNSLAASQGRVPVYGGSQAGASLQFRLAPSSARDPKAYVRAYRALVSRAESELAVGLSARLAAKVPVRVSAEARLTNNEFGTQVRPAFLAVTELRPQSLPAGLQGEAYVQGGYVGGAADTGFVEGQVAVTRQVKSFDLSQAKSARLSVGAAAWGGAQRDTQRIDLGPSVRLDMTLGKVPARLSVDWRERVVGDAEPGSGVAATISTRF